MSENIEPRKGEILFYTTESGNINLGVLFSEETVWLTQGQMVELFQRDKSVISKHIKNIFAEGELDPSSTVAKFATVQNEGGRQVSRELEYYNLDVIISVGYRVKSIQGTQFRIWATKTLREFIIKGFVLDDERLKNGVNFGKDYFDELLERIREIEKQYEIFRIEQDKYYECDFDRVVKGYLNN